TQQGHVRLGEREPEGRQEPRSEAADGIPRPESGAPDPRAIRAVPSGPTAGRRGGRNLREALARPAWDEAEIAPPDFSPSLAGGGGVPLNLAFWEGVGWFPCPSR